MASIKIYNDVVGSPHTFIGITDDYGNTIYRGFDKSGYAYEKIKLKGQKMNDNLLIDVLNGTTT